MTEVEPEEIHGVLNPVERDLARHGGHTEQTEVECHLTPGSYIVLLFTSSFSLTIKRLVIMTQNYDINPQFLILCKTKIIYNIVIPHTRHY